MFFFSFLWRLYFVITLNTRNVIFLRQRRLRIFLKPLFVLFQSTNIWAKQIQNVMHWHFWERGFPPFALDVYPIDKCSYLRHYQLDESSCKLTLETMCFWFVLFNIVIGFWSGSSWYTVRSGAHFWSMGLHFNEKINVQYTWLEGLFILNVKWRSLFPSSN